MYKIIKLVMNSTCKNTSETGLKFSISNNSLKCTKYNLGFQLCRINRSNNEVKYDKDDHNYQSISKSYDNKVLTYTKYSFFPTHLTSHIASRQK